jgi:PAS domain S-box-containing protein
MTTAHTLSDELLAALVANAGDAVIVADPSGVIRYWNAAAARMFGHAQADAIGASLDIIIPEKLRERHWDGYTQTMATGTTKYGERMLAVPALRADGARISVEFTVALLSDPSGEIQGIAAILRDVTARWEEQRALQKRLHELERDLRALEAAGQTGSPQPNA